MRVNIKIAFIVIVGLIALGLVLGFSQYAKKYFIQNNQIFNNLNEIQRLDNELNYEILASSMYLYYNTDILISNIHKIRRLIKQTKKIKFFKKHYNKAYKEFLKFEKNFYVKENMIFEFLRFSFPLKNSLIYLSNSLSYINPKNSNIKDILKVVSNIFLTKSSIDIDFIKNIELKKIEYLKNSSNLYEKAFYKNLKLFLTYFPSYKNYLTKILGFPTRVFLKKIKLYFLKKTALDLRLFNILSLILGLFVAFLILLISIAVYRHENMIKKITHLLYYDLLTSLPNRVKFSKDLKGNNIGVAVFNIDKFKNINDYFGIDIGDKVLQQIGKNLDLFFKKMSLKVYRVGADDFAVIFKGFSKEEILKIVKEAIEYIEKQQILINDTPFSLTLSAGISFEKPYLENADIALKKIKKDISEKIGVYNKEMNKEVQFNIEKTKEIKEAIENEDLIPYFQPIFDKEIKIVKYEVLCRVKIDNEIKSIFPYLDLLKEIRLYHKVTEKIINHSVGILEKYKDVNLSINLSIEDLMNKNTQVLIDKYFTNSLLANRVTFEILENEIQNYDIINEFIKKYKKYGITFAIDDFGSGYSNFHRILRMDVDFLKIDGSLIKNIDKDKTSKNIVETIVELAKKSNKKTIAEYVHSKEVFEECKKIGIDYFQGFYFQKPLPDLIFVKKM